MKDRLNTIDILRGLSVILMIYGHIYYIWPKMSNIIFEDIFIHIFLLAPPFFLIISGMSFFIYVNKLKSKEISKIYMFYEVFKRSCFLFIFTSIIQLIFGFTLNLQISFIIYWSIFQIISLSMIIFFFFLLLKQILRILLYIFSIIFIFIK
jgi:uncharacterized membrane protein